MSWWECRSLRRTTFRHPRPRPKGPSIPPIRLNHQLNWTRTPEAATIPTTPIRKRKLSGLETPVCSAFEPQSPLFENLDDNKSSTPKRAPHPEVQGRSYAEVSRSGRGVGLFVSDVRPNPCSPPSQSW